MELVGGGSLGLLPDEQGGGRGLPPAVVCRASLLLLG